MIKNLVILSLSTFPPVPKSTEYTAENGQFRATTQHTNESALKYIDWKLKRHEQKIDAIYAFVTDKARREALSKFQEIFDSYNFYIHQVPLFNDGDLEGSFISVANMFDYLQNYREEHADDDLVIHIDMTGGLRHGAVLMLALIQMLKYSNIKIGMVIYSNFSKHTIEIANGIMQMFPLISGADEFISFGSVKQINNYFLNKKDKISLPLKELLNTMEQLSETIRVCVNYQNMREVLFSLKEKLEQYKYYLQTNRQNNIDESELFFSKLIRTIEKEYIDILPAQKEDINVPMIIKWCITKGFLQQAIVFYTEWLPTYVVDKFLTIKDLSLYSDCKNKKDDWRDWEVYFLRMYMPAQYSVDIATNNREALNNTNEISYAILKDYLNKSKSIYTFKKKLGSKNPKLNAFLDKVIDFVQYTNINNFAKNVMTLSDDNLIKKVLTKNVPTNTTFKNFLTTRAVKSDSIEQLIINSLNGLSKKELIDIFDLADKHISNDKIEQNLQLTNESKANKRVEIFKYLLQHKMISSKLSTDNLLNFIYDYNFYVAQLRNQISHASSQGTNKRQNDNIANALVESMKALSSDKK